MNLVESFGIESATTGGSYIAELRKRTIKTVLREGEER